MSFEYFAGIAKLRAAAAESRAFANWLARYREFRGLSQRSAALANLESVLLGILQPAAAILILYLPWTTKMIFLGWVGVGLIIYAFYGYRNSELFKSKKNDSNDGH